MAECVTIYKAVKNELGKAFTEPVGYPDYHCFCLLDGLVQKTKVLNSFMTTDGKLRIVIATMAFSMGVDCPDIQNVIHYGPPTNVMQKQEEPVEVEVLLPPCYFVGNQEI